MKIKKLIPLIFATCLLFIGCASFKEGTYTGEAVGYNQESPIKVKVEIDSQGQITSIQSSHEESPEVADPAIEILTQDMIENNTYKVDHVAGATYTSKGFKEAVEDALSDEN